MKKILIAINAAILIFMISASVSAHGPAVNKLLERVEYQQKRIDQGIASGQLTRHEAIILRDNLIWIRDTGGKLGEDGKLTKREQIRLHRMLDRNSDMIYKKKHNPITRLYP